MKLDTSNLPGRVISADADKIIIVHNKSKIILKPTFEGVDIQVIGRDKNKIKKLFNKILNE